MDSLIAQVQQFGSKADFWAAVVNWLIFATAFVGVLYFAATIRLSVVSKKLREAQAALLQEKDRQLQSDLRDKDVKIGQAQQEAGAANKEAGSAKESAAKADERAGKANERAGQLEREAAQARQVAEELKKQNLATEENLEKERQKRLELEASLAPRWLIQSGPKVEALKKSFPGINVVMKFVLDAEPRNAAAQIRVVLHQVEWNIIDDQPVFHVLAPPMNGVTIESYRGAKPADIVNGGHEAQEQFRSEAFSEAAAKALAEFLTDQKWSATWMHAGRGQLPPNTIQINIDLKPSPYLMPEPMKELYRRIEEERQKAIERMQPKPKE